MLEAPSHVVRTSKGETKLGGQDGDFAERVAATFRAANIETAAVDDPFYCVWEKQVFGGVIKPLAVLTRLSDRELVSDDNIRRIRESLVWETAAAANALRYAIAPDEIYAELCSIL